MQKLDKLRALDLPWFNASPHALGLVIVAMQILYAFVHWLIWVVQPILVPLCFVFAWTLVGITLWSFWTAIRDGVTKTKQMHQIPCANCQFFTGDYRLKCPVRPVIALSEDAINCSDYEPIR